MNKMQLVYAANLATGLNCHLLIDTRSDAALAQGALLDALVLHEIERMTQSFEDAFGHPLDWKALESTGCQPEKAQLELSLTFDQSCLVNRATLVFPPRLLPLLMNWSITDSPGLCDMGWNSLPSTLVLGEFSLSADEQGNLGNGAVLLISESFQSQWKATLAVGSDLFLAGYFSSSTDEWQRARMGGDSLSTSAGILYELLNESISQESQSIRAPAELEDGKYRLEFDCSVDPIALLKPDAIVHVGLLDTGMVSSLRLISSAGVVFTGKLLPLGAGHALLLEQVDMAVC